MADPKIKYDIEASTKGGSEVEQLAEQLKKLDTSIDPEIAARAEKLEADLQRLGAEKSAISNFQLLQNAVGALGIELLEARTGVQQVGAQLVQASAATQNYARTELEAKAALEGTKTQLDATRRAFNDLQASTTGSARSTTEYRTASEEMRSTIQRLSAETRQQNVELKAAAAETKAAQLAENSLSAQYEKSAISLNRLQAEQQEKTAGLNASRTALNAAGIESSNLAQKERELAVSMQAVRENVGKLPAELDALKRKQQETADAAAKAAEEFRNAFSKVGVQSAQALEAEIGQVRQSLDTLKASGNLSGAALQQAFAAGETRISALQRELREVNGQMTLADRAAKLFSGSIGQITAGNAIADGVGYLVNKVKELGTAFVETIVQTEQMRRGLNSIYGSAQTTASQMAFLMRTALSAGVAVGDIGQSFVKFSAATKSSNIPLEVTNGLFSAVTRSAGALGLSGEQVTGMLEALGQMASKGTVQMEELRGQLGDRLPGALSLVAQGFGITEAQLGKLVEGGQLAARDLFPALTKALGSMQGEVSGLAPAWENLKSVMTQTAQSAGDSGWTNLLTLGLKGLASVLAVVVLPLSYFSELVFSGAKAVGVLAGALATLTSPLDALSKLFSDATERQGSLTSAFGQAIGVTDAAKVSTVAHSEALRGTVLAMDVVAARSVSTAQGQVALALATKLAGDSSLDASAKYVQLGAQLAGVLDLLAKETAAAETNAKAIAQQGATLVDVAKLRGDEAKTMEASAIAADNNVAALVKVESAHRAQLEVLQIAHDALLQLAAAQENGLELRKQEILASDKKIITSKAEAAQAQAATEAAKQEALQRKLAVETAGDQSLAIERLGAARDAALRSLELTIEFEKAGAVTQEDVRVAQEKAAVAIFKYNDALNDKFAGIERTNSMIAANNTLEQAGLGLQMAVLKAAESKARADGDEYAVHQSLIAQKQLEIKILTLTVAGKIAESNAQVAMLKLKQAELSINDPLYAQKQAAYELSIKSAEAAILQAKAAGESVGALERELKALKDGSAYRGEANKGIEAETYARTGAIAATNEQIDAMDRLMMRYKLSADYSESQIALLEKENALVERRIELENKRLGQDKNGFATDKAGNTVVAGGDLTSRTGIKAFLKSAGVDDDASATKITNEFANSQGEIDYFNNAGQRKYNGSTISDALLKAAEKYTFSAEKIAAAEKTNAAAKTTTSSTTATATSAAANSSTVTHVYTVNVVDNGKTTAINTADESSAKLLRDLLQSKLAAGY